MARLKTRTTARYFENNKYVTDGLKCWTKSGTEFECRVECPYNKVKHEKDCVQAVCEDALALINELTEENERLRGIGTPDDEAYIRLSDAKNAIMDYIGEQTVSKYASEAECKSARSGAEGAMNELDYITPVKVAPIAGTVRKMQERLNEAVENSGNRVYTGSHIHLFLDQIANELKGG